MTPETDKIVNPSHGLHLKVGDWDVMFCAVLARLSSSIEPQDLKSAQWNCVADCVESLQLLRQSALLHWEQLEHSNTLTSPGLLALAESKAQIGGRFFQGEQP